MVSYMCQRTKKQSVPYPATVAAVQSWWTQFGMSAAGAREKAALVPRLWPQHFTSTSLIAEQQGRFVGFLVGFLSRTGPRRGTSTS